MSYGTPTVRRYPRTLREAFPRGFEDACAVEVYRRPLLSVVDLIGAVLLALLLLALLLHGFDALFV